MKTPSLYVAVFILFFASSAHAEMQIQATEAQATNPEWTDYNIGDPGTTNAQQGKVLLDSDVNESDGTEDDINEVITGSEPNDEAEDKDHKGEIDIESFGATADDSDKPIDVDASLKTNDLRGIDNEDVGVTTDKKEVGEKSGTEDINIGIGELEETQHNQTDLDFVHERAASVSVSKVEVRGWDPQKKESILGMVKSDREVQTGEDLERFAQKILLQNEQVESIGTDTESITVKYRVPAKLFGIFKTHIDQESTIRFGDGEHGKRVKVKFPWTRFFYRVDSRFHVGTMEQALFPEVDDEVLVNTEHGEPSPQDQATAIKWILSTLSV